MMTRKQHVDYWLHGATENLKDMRSAIKSKRRTNAMFCGHLAVEKMLKALCAVRNIPIDREHKLLVLAKDSGFITQLSATEQQELLKHNYSIKGDSLSWKSIQFQGKYGERFTLY